MKLEECMKKAAIGQETRNVLVLYARMDDLRCDIGEMMDKVYTMGISGSEDFVKLTKLSDDIQDIILAMLNKRINDTTKGCSIDGFKEI